MLNYRKVVRSIEGCKFKKSTIVIVAAIMTVQAPNIVILGIGYISITNSGAKSSGNGKFLIINTGFYAGPEINPGKVPCYDK